MNPILFSKPFSSVSGRVRGKKSLLIKRKKSLLILRRKKKGRKTKRKKRKKKREEKKKQKAFFYLPFLSGLSLFRILVTNNAANHRNAY